MNNFKVGAIVRLKSGGPSMTFEGLDNIGRAICSWFHEGKYQQKTFTPETLEEVKEEKQVTLKR